MAFRRISIVLATFVAATFGADAARAQISKDKDNSRAPISFKHDGIGDWKMGAPIVLNDNIPDTFGQLHETVDEYANELRLAIQSRPQFLGLLANGYWQHNQHIRPVGQDSQHTLICNAVKKVLAETIAAGDVDRYYRLGVVFFAISYNQTNAAGVITVEQKRLFASDANNGQWDRSYWYPAVHPDTVVAWTVEELKKAPEDKQKQFYSGLERVVHDLQKRGVDVFYNKYMNFYTEFVRVWSGQKPVPAQAKSPSPVKNAVPATAPRKIEQQPARPNLSDKNLPANSPTLWQRMQSLWPQKS
jgi:hypothetical protein